MDIKTIKIKEYNAPYKMVLVVNGNPICIARPKRMTKLINYLMNGSDIPEDGRIKKILDEIKNNNTLAKYNFDSSSKVNWEDIKNGK